MYIYDGYNQGVWFNLHCTTYSVRPTLYDLQCTLTLYVNSIKP